MAPVPVYDYQRRWINETARRAIYLKARQIGITWGTMLGCVIACLTRRCSWYYLSASERLAEEAIEYAQLHCQAMKLGLSIEANEVLFEGMRERQLSIRFANGSKLVGLPANPRTARGCSGNVVLDEFGHHQDAAKIYTAVYPMTTRGHKLRILSTPNGKQGPFYDIWNNAEEKKFATHKTDVYEAVDGGFDIDIEDLKLGYTSDGWAQEYECDFLDESTAWLPYSLIESAYDPRATMELPISFCPIGEMYAGRDVARKRDLTVDWLLEHVEGEYITRAVMALQNVTFERQRAVFNGYMPMITRSSIDANGTGAQLAEEAEAQWPGMAEGVSMNGQVPAILASLLKDAMERGILKIPNDPDIRKDLHMVRRTYTDAGNVRFEAPRTKDGHADRFWAAALALHSADSAPAAAWSFGTAVKDAKAQSHPQSLMSAPVMSAGPRSHIDPEAIIKQAKDGFSPFGLADLSDK